MSAYLITGRPGTGKSTIAETLIRQGYNAHDLEEVAGVIRLEIKASGKPVNWPTGYVNWDYYAWNLQEGPLMNFLEAQGDRETFVSVSATNQQKFYHLFDKVFALTVDSPQTLRHRLENRNVHQFNQGPDNIQHAVERYAQRTDELLASGCIPLDNTLAPETVVSNLMAQIHEGK